MINRLAAQSLPADLPAFLHTPEAINEIEYLGPEPDRWRSRAEPELNAAQAPDHFIDLELADLIGPLPRRRYEYIADLYTAGLTYPKLASQLQPDRVGFQPYITEEVWERLKAAMREYRQLSAQHQDTQPVEAAILFYAGWLGHYVGDGSQPLHVTVNYDGWVEPNPNGYTTDRGIHSRFESAFVSANIKSSDVQPLMTPVHPIGDEWTAYLDYLRHTATCVETLYQLDKDAGFEGAGSAESRHFTAERLAAGASMLRDLIAAAWTKSADPVPDGRHPEDRARKPSSSGETSQAANPEAGMPNAAPSPAGSADGPDVPFIGKAYYPGHGISYPILKSSGSLPDMRPAGRMGGTAVVGLVVDENGIPRNVHIVRSAGESLDKMAIVAVKQYRFHPALWKGKPVPVEINIEIRYNGQ